MSTFRNKTFLLRNIMHVLLTITLILPALYLRAPTVTRADIHSDFVVNSLADNPDQSPLDNECLDSEGKCTLRAAIEQINTQYGNHTIVFIPTLVGTITLSKDLGDIYINANVTISGLGTEDTIIDAKNNSRVFRIASGRIVALNNLTIQNGRVVDDNGGGIYNEGTLSIIDCMITDNQALGDDGDMIGGGFGGGIYNSGTLVVTRSTIYSNEARGGDGLDGGADSGAGGGGGGGAALGGGIFNDAGGLITIINSTISGNQANGGDGGNSPTSAPQPTGSGGNGGGPGGAGGTPVSLAGQSGGEPGGGGGGGGSSIGAGGGGGTGGFGGGGGGGGGRTTGGGGIGGGGGTGGFGGGGGGSGRSALGGGGGGGGGLGAGVFHNGDTITITHSTIFSNTARGGSGGTGGDTGNIVDDGGNGQGIGGGIYNNGTAIYLGNSIVFDNSADSDEDCGSVTSQGYNLTGNGTGCPSGGTDISTSNAKLGALADNGGETYTHALLIGSPAVNAGSGPPCAVSTDQRSVSRPQGAGCDIGAYEATADLTVNISVSNPNPGLGEQITYTVVITNSGALTATQVAITDNIPAGLTFVPGSITIEPAGAGTIGSPPTLVSGLTISAGIAVTTTFALMVDYGLENGTEIENTVEVGGAEDTAYDTDVLSITVEAPDLVVRKTATPDNPPVGTLVTYEIVVENQGDQDATGAVLSDTLHALLEPVESVAQEGGGGVTTYTDGWLFASGLTITQGESITFTLEARVSYGPGEGTHRIDVPDGTVIPNTVQVSSTEVITALTYTENITVSAPTLVPTKSVSDDVPWKGETITYTIVVENTGSGDASDVTIWDAIPDEFTLIEDSVMLQSSGGTFALPAGGAPLMVHSVPLASQESLTLTFAVIVNDDVADGTLVTNTAYITSTEVAAPKESTQVVTVRYPILSLTKTSSNPTPALNRSFEYEIVVTNDGSVAATNAVISDTLSEDLLFAGPVTIEPPQPGAEVAQVADDLPTLVSKLTIAAFDSVTVTFPVTVSTSLTIGDHVANTAAVTSDEVSTPVTNTSGSADIEVMGTELIVTKTASDEHPDPGDYITYTIVVENAGYIDAHQAVISDTLAPTLRFMGPVVVEPWQEGITVAQSADDLPVLVSGLTITQGEKATVTFKVRVLEGLQNGDLIYNVAYVTAIEVPAPQSNSDHPTEIVVEDTIPPLFIQPTTLLTPPDGTVTETLRPFFSWYSAIDNSIVVSYTVVITGKTSYTFTVSAMPDVTSFTPAMDLELDAYSWTVVAYDSAGNAGATDDIFEFEIREAKLIMYLPMILSNYP